MSNIERKRATKKNKSKETYKKYGKYSSKNIRIKNLESESSKIKRTK